MGKRIRRRALLKAINIGAIIMATILGACCAFIEFDKERKTSMPTEKKAENLVIETPEPCRTGTLIIKNAEGNLYEYTGPIQIENDGKDGNEIAINIDL